MNPIIRPTGILIEEGRLLLVKRDVNTARHWALPGGKLEWGETIEQCLIREIKEETGLDVKAKELLYITDRFRHVNNHVVHITFLVERTGEKLPFENWQHQDLKEIREVKMVPVEEITSYGFSSAFYRLVKDNFPGRGSYHGDFHQFYGES